MSKTTIDRRCVLEDESVDPEVLAFRQQFDEKSPLDELVREGARRMLQSAIDAEVDAFIARYPDRLDTSGRRLVVKNGSLPAREILTGAGPVEVRQGRVRDSTPDPEKRVQFSPSVLPAYLRRTEAIEELIPWLYLKGVSTGDFGEALQALVGERARGLSANVVVRLKEQWADEKTAGDTARSLVFSHFRVSEQLEASRRALGAAEVIELGVNIGKTALGQTALPASMVTALASKQSSCTDSGVQ